MKLFTQYRSMRSEAKADTIANTDANVKANMYDKVNVRANNADPRIQRICAMLIAFAVIISMMPALCFAEAIDSDDPVENESTDTATIYVGKELSVSQDGQFPSVTDFKYKLQAERAWTSSNELAQKHGEEIAPDRMPMPTEDGSAHRSIQNSGSVSAITIGNFQDYDDVDAQDTQKKKFRYTPVSITFNKPGYYLYKLTEDGSVPNIPGMDYDEHSYYVAVYVCSKTDQSGNTEDGVYVHNITSYRNAKEDEEIKPDLSEIDSVSDVNGTNITAALENNAENLGKVGISGIDPRPKNEIGIEYGPNKLDAFRFFTEFTTQDIVIKNRVTGNLGDKSKKFEYTVSLTGLEPDRRYTTDQAAQFISPALRTKGSVEISQENGDKGSYSSIGRSFTSNDDGELSFKLKLASGGVLVLNALPAGAKYTIEQGPADHIASYEMTSTAGSPQIIAASKNNEHTDLSLSTEEETIDRADETVVISFRNHRDLVTPTGLPYHGDLAYVMTAILMAAVILSVFGIRRRRRGEQ
ncbi:MAG: hypothetical protein IJH95_06920 [Mogibacterium sp.]|nr:hypothetical protein [Mogibacterium sp.]